MATGAVVARILTQYSDKGSKAAQKDINKLGKNFDAFGKKAAKAFGIAAAASAAFALKIGKDAVDAAIQDQASQALLANSLRNTVGATDAAIAGTETYITAMQKQFNVVDDELRPAMAGLVAVTGSVSAAQTLMQTALDVSANSGADLASSVDAIVKATRGQYKGLANLVKGLDAGILATKDFGKIINKVSQITGGAAATRAQTLEYRLIGLKIAYGEILETLGYALLPVIERFVSVVSTKVLPQLETWIAANKDRLAASFQVAADYAVKLLGVAIAFGDWVSNNTGKVQFLAGIIATMFAINGISKFIIAIDGIIAAMAILRTTALGAAVATALATGGVSIGTAVTALAAVGATALVTKNLFGIINGKGDTGVQSGKGISPRGNSNNIDFGKTIGNNDAYNAFLAALNKNTTAVKKNTLTAFDIATENAQKELAARQKALSGSASIAVGGGGKVYSTRNATGGFNVIVNAGNVVGSSDALVQAVQVGLQTANRRNGAGGSGRPMSMVL
jgi:hypothetical protein